MTEIKPGELRPFIGGAPPHATDADAVLADCCVETTRRHELIPVRVAGVWFCAVIIREKSEAGKEHWRTFGIGGVGGAFDQEGLCSSRRRRSCARSTAICFFNLEDTEEFALFP